MVCFHFAKYMRLENAELKQEKSIGIITKCILPFLQRIVGPLPIGLPEILVNNSRVVNAVTGQYIEEAGAAADGHLLFFENGIARNFYYDSGSARFVTTHITKKHEVLLDVNSFLYGSSRPGSIQMLENGSVLLIAYSALRGMLLNFPVLNTALWQLQAEKERQFLYYQHLLKLPLDERVQVYLDDNPGITSRILHDHIANYLGTCRSGFSTSFRKYRGRAN